MLVTQIQVKEEKSRSNMKKQIKFPISPHIGFFQTYSNAG